MTDPPITECVVDKIDYQRLDIKYSKWPHLLGSLAYSYKDTNNRIIHATIYTALFKYCFLNVNEAKNAAIDIELYKINEYAKSIELYKKWGFDRIIFQRDRGDMGKELFKNSPKKTVGKTCNFLWHQSVVNWNGSVSPCCLYYNEKYDFGNAFEEGFSNVWNNEKYQTARKMVISKKAMDKNIICFNCLKNGFPS